MANHYSSRNSNQEGIALSSGWVACAVVLAIFLHFLFYLLLTSTELKSFGEAYYEKIVPRSFKLKRVEIPERLLNEEQTSMPEPKPEPSRDIASLLLPQEQPQASLPPEQIKVQPQADPSSEIAAAISDGSPPISADVQQALEQALANQNPSSAASELPEVDLSELTAGQDIDSAPPLVVPKTTGNRNGVGNGGTQFTDLDALLAATGPAIDEQPILMDAGLLFDYDSVELRAEATGELEKVATLIARSPNSQIIIEGHTDSFGSAGYNFELSRQRALSVKSWLQVNAGISPDRIATTGFGKTRLLAPASGTIEEQQINRRVEITINSPR